jgi:methylphosphotriester-DNA--protein-cysteine methyltransferase
MVLLRLFSSKKLLFLGLELAGFTGYAIQRNEKKMNCERLKDSFYASPHMVEMLFNKKAEMTKKQMARKCRYSSCIIY